ncbi:MAG TPA: TetR/AcrR family transcriptional regulator [Leucothrix mucor]|nr:TetR/AcrR family transcriptional regulator [Leucothrix mucor]
MPYLKKDNPVPEPLDCRILTAALDLFVDSGYHKVSIHQIQSQADVSIGSIYNHFGGKEGVAKALYNHINNEIEELIEGVVNVWDSPMEQCKEIIRQLFEHTETHKNIISFVFHAKHTEFLSSESLGYSSSPLLSMQNIVIKGIEKQEFIDIDPWVVTSTIFGGAIRMIQLRLDGVVDKPLPEYYESVTQAALKGVVAD